MSQPVPMDTMETLFSRVESMHGIVNLDAISTLLQSMLTHMHKQEQSISLLTKQMSATVLPSVALFREHLQRVEKRLTTVDEKVERALRAATARLVDTE
jgi:hypothetical protein